MSFAEAIGLLQKKRLDETDPLALQGGAERSSRGLFASILEKNLAALDAGLETPDEEIPQMPVLQPTPEQIREQRLSNLEMEHGGVVGDIKQRFVARRRMSEIERGIAAAMNENDPDKTKELVRIRREVMKLQEESAKDDTSGFFGQLADVVGYMYDNFSKSIPDIAAGAALGTALPGLGTIAGAGAGLLEGQWRNTAMQGAGMIYADLVEKGVKPEIARKVAMGGGAVYGVIEQIASVLPAPIQASLAKPFERYMARKLADAALRVAGRYAANVAGEVTEEGLQQLTEDSSYAVARYLQEGIAEDGSPLEAITSSEAFERAFEASRQSVLPMLVLGGVSAGGNIIQAKRGTTKAAAAEKQLGLTPEQGAARFEAEVGGKTATPGAFSKYLQGLATEFGQREQAKGAAAEIASQQEQAKLDEEQAKRELVARDLWDKRRPMQEILSQLLGNDVAKQASGEDSFSASEVADMLGIEDSATEAKKYVVESLAEQARPLAQELIDKYELRTDAMDLKGRVLLRRTIASRLVESGADKTAAGQAAKLIVPEPAQKTIEERLGEYGAARKGEEVGIAREAVEKRKAESMAAAQAMRSTSERLQEQLRMEDEARSDAEMLFDAENEQKLAGQMANLRTGQALADSVMRKAGVGKKHYEIQTAIMELYKSPTAVNGKNLPALIDLYNRLYGEKIFDPTKVEDKKAFVDSIWGEQKQTLAEDKSVRIEEVRRALLDEVDSIVADKPYLRSSVVGKNPSERSDSALSRFIDKYGRETSEQIRAKIVAGQLSERARLIRAIRSLAPEGEARAGVLPPTAPATAPATTQEKVEPVTHALGAATVESTIGGKAGELPIVNQPVVPKGVVSDGAGMLVSRDGPNTEVIRGDGAPLSVSGDYSVVRSFSDMDGLELVVVRTDGKRITLTVNKKGKIDAAMIDAGPAPSRTPTPNELNTWLGPRMANAIRAIAGRISGKDYTIDDLEREMLTMFREPVAPAAEPESARAGTEVAKPPELMTPEGKGELNVRRNTRDISDVGAVRSSLDARQIAGDLADIDNAIRNSPNGSLESYLEQQRAVVGTKRERPQTQKNIERAEWLLKNYVREGDRYAFKGEATPATTLPAKPTEKTALVAKAEELLGKPLTPAETALVGRASEAFTVLSDPTFKGDIVGKTVKGIQEGIKAKTGKTVNVNQLVSLLRLAGYEVPNRGKGTLASLIVGEKGTPSLTKAADKRAETEAIGREAMVEERTPLDAAERMDEIVAELKGGKYTTERGNELFSQLIEGYVERGYTMEESIRAMQKDLGFTKAKAQSVLASVQKQLPAAPTEKPVQGAVSPPKYANPVKIEFVTKNTRGEFRPMGEQRFQTGTLGSTIEAQDKAIQDAARAAGLQLTRVATQDRTGVIYTTKLPGGTRIEWVREKMPEGKAAAAQEREPGVFRISIDPDTGRVTSPAHELTEVVGIMAGRGLQGLYGKQLEKALGFDLRSAEGWHKLATEAETQAGRDAIVERLKGAGYTAQEGFRGFVNRLIRIWNSLTGMDVKELLDKDWQKFSEGFRNLSVIQDIARMDAEGRLYRERGMRASKSRQQAVTPEQDREYLAAVERGDMETAQRMVDEAAKAAGYNIEGWHGTVQDFNIFRKKAIGSGIGGYKPRTKTGEFYFGRTRDRAEIAADYMATEDDPNRRIIKVWLRDPDASHPDELIVPANRARDIKSADAITRDDKGRVIPLSERFNPKSPDIRYQSAIPKTPDTWQEARKNSKTWDEYTKWRGTQSGPMAQVGKASYDAWKEARYEGIGPKEPEHRAAAKIVPEAIKERADENRRRGKVPSRGPIRSWIQGATDSFLSVSTKLQTSLGKKAHDAWNSSAVKARRQYTDVLNKHRETVDSGRSNEAKMLYDEARPYAVETFGKLGERTVDSAIRAYNLARHMAVSEAVSAFDRGGSIGLKTWLDAKMKEKGWKHLRNDLLPFLRTGKKDELSVDAEKTLFTDSDDMSSIKMSIRDLANLNLTASQKKLADFYAREYQRWGADYARKRKELTGEDVELDAFYIPKERDYQRVSGDLMPAIEAANKSRPFKSRQLASNVDLGALGIAQKREYTAIPLMLRGELENLNNHVNDIARYVGLAEFFDTWKSIFRNQNIVGDLRDAIGQTSIDSLNAKLDQIEGIIYSDTAKPWEKLGSTILGRTTSAALMGPAIVLYQPISAMQYGLAHGWGNMVKAIGQMATADGRELARTLIENAPIIKHRADEIRVEPGLTSSRAKEQAIYYTRGVGSKTARMAGLLEQTQRGGLWGLQKADELSQAIGLLTVYNKYKSQGKEIDMAKIAAEAEGTMIDTQSSADPMDMSGLRMSKSGIVRLLSLLSGEASAIFNTITRNTSEAVDVANAYRAGKATPEQVRAAFRNTAATLFTVAMMQAWVASIKAGRDKLVSDDGEEEDWVKKAKWRFLEGMTGLLPFPSVAGPFSNQVVARLLKDTQRVGKYDWQTQTFSSFATKLPESVLRMVRSADQYYRASTRMSGDKKLSAREAARFAEYAKKNALEGGRGAAEVLTGLSIQQHMAILNALYKKAIK